MYVHNCAQCGSVDSCSGSGYCHVKATTIWRHIDATVDADDANAISKKPRCQVETTVKSASEKNFVSSVSVKRITQRLSFIFLSRRLSFALFHLVYF